ncbi:MAG: hypothetical protein ACRDOI_00155 [Trebonia sp.]
MTVWDEVKQAISRLLDQRPGALMSYPSLEEHTDRVPPCEIRLAPWAAGTAEDLHRQFGHSVELMVGFLPYPPDRQKLGRNAPGQLPDLIDPHEIAVAFESPAIVSSGHTLHHELAVRNLKGDELQIATNGNLTAIVVDPGTGEVVGGYANMQTMRLEVFRIPPGSSTRIPMLIGTACLVPRLGYTVPPGEWGVRVVLNLDSPFESTSGLIPGSPPRLRPGPRPGDALRRLTPILPLTITA